MKVLLLNTLDSHGGAAIATFRLMTSLKNHGIDVTLGVVEKLTANENVLLLPNVIIEREIEKAKNNVKDSIVFIFKSLISRVKKRIFFKSPIVINIENIFETTNVIYHSENDYSIIDVNFINESDYDIVHLNWIHDNMISIEDIAKISKPLVWTMHDSWVFCGAEHHPNVWEIDTRYKDGYTDLTKPSTTKGPDICKKVWERKRQHLFGKKISFISPSNFEKKLLQESALFSHSFCKVIPNIIPNNIFYPKNKEIIREILKLPKNKKIICFGAAYNILDSKSIKGGNLLLDTLRKIKDPDSYHLLVFGPANENFTKALNISVFFTGYVENPIILSTLYNACDIFVNPSVIENLSTTCIEALFCGLPVCAFNTGGMSDIVEHKITGYLAPLFDTEELQKGILYCIENHDILSKNSILKSKNSFNEEVIIGKHKEIYEMLLSNDIPSINNSDK